VAAMDKAEIMSENAWKAVDWLKQRSKNQLDPFRCLATIQHYIQTHTEISGTIITSG